MGKREGGRCSYTQMESNVSKAGPEQVNASENGAASTHPTQTHRHEGSGALAPRNEEGGDGGLCGRGTDSGTWGGGWRFGGNTCLLLQFEGGKRANS